MRAGSAAAAALVAAALTAFVYRGVLGAYFWNDDFVWLYLLHDASPAEFLLTPLGGHTLVARNAVFALTHALAGLDPRPYFAIALATHVVNVVLLARVVRLFTGRGWLAAAGALAWGIVPSAAETLAWYAVYGQVAATTCILLALARLGARVRDQAPIAGRDLATVGLWLATGSLFFGSAGAVALVLPAVVWLLRPGMLRDGRRIASVLLVTGATIALYALLQAIGVTMLAAPDVPGGSLQALAHDLPTAARAFVHLVRVGVSSLVLGAWWRPEPRADGASWLALGAVTALTAAAAAVADRDGRRRLAAALVLALACWGLVAAARAPLARTLLGLGPAALAATPRYHYTAQAFVALALCLALRIGTARLGRSLATTAAGAWAALLLAGALHDGIPIDRHDAARAEIRRALATLHDEVAASSDDPVSIRNAPIAAFGWMPNTTVALPGLAALFVIVSPNDELDGHPIRFVEPDPRVRELFRRRGGRLGALLVAPAG